MQDVREWYRMVMKPSMVWLETNHGIPATPQADTMLLAVAGTESGLTARRQYAGGAARGLWQFEPSGVVGVIRHARSRAVAEQVMRSALIPWEPGAIHEALEYGDQVAAIMARLLLWTDPAPLPREVLGGWAIYRRTWMPGKPSFERWEGSYGVAVEIVSSAI